MRPAVVVDTNVPVAANGKASQTGPECQLACIDALESIRKRNCVLLDSHDRIIEEYRRQLSPKGQPGVGDMFFKWLWDNQGNPRHCGFVEITPLSGHEEGFEEFPRDPALATFDKSDRKFVAVAIASGRKPVIFNAVDSDWRDHAAALERNGIRVKNLC